MNIGNIKTFLGGDEAVRPDTKIKEQLQAEGLKQAREFQQTTVVGSFSSQYSIAYKALGESLKQNVEVDGQKDTKNTEDAPEEKAASGFDFEAIAENVMRFVGGVIRTAAKNGADDEKLNDLFSQARDGVSRGIGLAKKDLSGLMTDELSDGIGKAEKSIFNQIDRLEQSIFAPQVASETLSAEFASFKGSELLIRTKDGDEIKLSFQQQQATYFEQSSSTSFIRSGEENTVVNSNSSQFGFFERQGISLQVSGDVDEEELGAIKGLVDRIANVSDEFFNGNVEKAFEDSLSLGYDKEELVGFSLQLTKANSASVVSAYEDVKQYKEEESSASKPREIRPILSYVDNVLRTMDNASKLLNGMSDYNNIVTDIVNRMDEDIKTPDLVSAINRFNQFNKEIVESAAKQTDQS